MCHKPTFLHWVLYAAAAGFGLSGCGGDSPSFHSGGPGGAPGSGGSPEGGLAPDASGGNDGGTVPDGPAPSDKTPTAFISDDPTSASTATSTQDAGTAASAPAANADSAKTGEAAERAIVEADIINVDGNTLYALSQYGGLAVVDISSPQNLRMLGRKVVRAKPFEMYVRSGIAFAMYSSYPRWTESSSGYWESHVTSRLVAFDVRNPAAITEVGAFDLPGEVSDSRMVGDVIYVASYENGYCWRCTQNQPRTTVTSIAIGDPAAIRQVQQVDFNDPKGTWSWYRRSLSVTTNRMYVSGMVFDGTWGTDSGHSTIQVVDISDPAGKITLGAEVAVTGQIENRWEMDETDGVLRTVSQAGSTWSNGPAPTVETFRVESAQTVTPLGKLTLELPKRENLKSARFDGPRAYAVTFEQKDPLFTLDLSDPANPKQVGTLEMPGYLYHMEPRGDRLVALGLDNGNTSGGMTVSIFDVANLAKPTMLSRANFGGTWSWTVEDQDRIHKAFKLFEDEGLITMPFSGWSYRDGGCGQYTSGIQLFDYTRDTVTARGVAQVRGQAKRAFLHQKRLFAMSDDQVASFEIDNRDAPTRLGTVALANNAQKAVRVGENLVALGSDWYTQEPQIVVVPVAGRPSALPIATIDLARVVAPSNEGCTARYWSSFAQSSQLFVNGNQVYVAYNAGFAGEQGSMGFAVIDLTTPQSPVLAGHKLLPIGSTASSSGGPYYYSSYAYGCGVGYYYGGNGVYAAGERIVRVGTSLVLQDLVPEPVEAGTPYYYAPPEAKARLQTVDLSNPADIRLVSTTPIADGVSSGGMFVDGTTVLTSHSESVEGDSGRVRFYVDRVDMAAPAAPKREKVNVPGSLFGVDTAGRVVTIDYTRTVKALDSSSGTYVWDQCATAQTFGTYNVTYASTDAGARLWSQPEYCIKIDRSFKLVDLSGGSATLLDTYVPTGAPISQVQLGADRLYLIRRETPTPMTDGGTSQYETTIDLLTGIRAGRFAQSASFAAPRYPTATASGTRLGIAPSWNNPNLVVFDTLDPTKPTTILQSDQFYNQYYSMYGLTIDSSYVVLAMGQYGVGAVRLP